jgi:serine/threonine protein kinase
MSSHDVACMSAITVQIQSSMRGISSLAKETTKLEVGRDATGATVINQYVVVKTLGRGSFGKVKLCLNTIDGQLYAVKVSRKVPGGFRGHSAGVQGRGPVG